MFFTKCSKVCRLFHSDSRYNKLVQQTITIINEMNYDRQSVLDLHHHQDQRLTQRLKRVEQLHIMMVLLMAASHGKAHETTAYEYRYRRDLRSEYLLCCKADKSCDYYHEL